MSNSSIWLLDKTLSGATTLGQSRPGSEGNEGVLHISQSSWAGALSSDCLMSYPGHSLEEFYSSTGCSQYSTVPVDCWLVVLFYGVSTLFRSFNAKLSHFDKTLKQFCLV